MDRNGQTIAAAIRQAELEKAHRDTTKTVNPPGTDGESLRAVKGFEQITDEMLEERARFNLKDHMNNSQAAPPAIQADRTLDLSSMTPEELRGLAAAAEQQAAMKEKI